jgi:nucleotide-binding universal stress UspA family protein
MEEWNQADLIAMGARRLWRWFKKDNARQFCYGLAV